LIYIDFRVLKKYLDFKLSDNTWSAHYVVEVDMDEKNDGDQKVDDVILPGFRFHPTDEELVGFYLKRKVQQQPLSIELIKQLDIYKYDPWDLPSKIICVSPLHLQPFLSLLCMQTSIYS